METLQQTRTRLGHVEVRRHLNSLITSSHIVCVADHFRMAHTLPCFGSTYATCLFMYIKCIPVEFVLLCIYNNMFFFISKLQCI